MITPINITAYSTARYGTWYFLDQYHLLFDIGDGTVANLHSKCGKVRNAFFSHADRDHLGGIIQFYQTVAAGPNPPTFYYPKDSGSFPALKDFLQKFDPNLPPCEWIPIEGGIRIQIAKNQFIQIGENDHIASENPAAKGLTKSLDFTLIETKRKLKAEFQSLSGQEIGYLRTEKGEDHITDIHERHIFSYSGDTPSFNQERWSKTEILAHEATFITPDESDRGHCELTDVIRKASELDLKALILTHISTRYKKDDILKAIRETAEEVKPDFHIFAILPGEVVWNVLAQDSVWGN